MNLEQYYLVKIAEEASELAQAALKAVQFGSFDVGPDTGKTNLLRIAEESADLIASLEEYERVSSNKLDFDGVDDHIDKKKRKMLHWRDFSEKLGLVEGSNHL